MKKIMLIALVFSVSYTHASDWSLLDTSDIAQVYLDKSSVARFGKIRKAWIAYSYKDAETYNGKSYKSSKTLGLYSCAERTSGIYQSTSYADEYGKGLVISSWQIPSKDVHFSEVVPDSIGEVTIDAICKIKLPAA